MERRKIISVAVFSAAIAGGGVAGVILGAPASGSAAASSPTTSAAKPHRFGFGRGMGGGMGGGAALDAAAKAIGVSTDTLQTDLKNGQTIAQVAKSKNVSTQTVIDAMVASAKQSLDAQVKAGHLSSDMEKKIESGLDQMITNQVNGTFPKPSFRGAPGSGWQGGGGPGRMGPGGGYGPQGGGSGNGNTSTSESGAPTV
jgi:hypothetical protein